MPYRAIFKRYCISTIVNLEKKQQLDYLFLKRNKLTREIIQIATEHNILFIDHKMKPENGGNICVYPLFYDKALIFKKKNETNNFVLYVLK